MDSIRKLKSSEYVRKIGENIFRIVPLPKINPDVVSALSLVISVFILFTANIYHQVLILSLVWLLDILDGAIAIKHHVRKTEEDKLKGWMVDVTADRLSEGIISLAYFIPMFPLFILNTILTLWSFKKKIHIILPLRQGLFVYLLIKAIIG